VPVGDPNDLLDLLDGLGHHHGRGRVVVPGREREGVAELAQIVLGGEQGVGPDDAAELLQSG
jgi:hypothetical protein